MSEEVLIKLFPVVEGNTAQLYEEMVNREYKNFIPPEKNLSFIPTCDRVKTEFMEEFQKKLINELKQFGYPNEAPKDTKVDRFIGKFLYENMSITPSAAATLGMWQFMNLNLFSEVVFWRWGRKDGSVNKERFLSSNRNYMGTQWWRYFFFIQFPDLASEYRDVTEDELVQLYERPRTRGMPEHVRNNVIWYRELCKKYDITERLFYRVVIQAYNEELGFRNYFSLNRDDLHEIYESAFSRCLGKEKLLKNIVPEDDGIGLFEEEILEEQDVSEQNESKTEVSSQNIKDSSDENETERPKKRIVIIKNNSSKGMSYPVKNDLNNTNKPGVISDERIIFTNNLVSIERDKSRNMINVYFKDIPKEIIKMELRRIGFEYKAMDRKWVTVETSSIVEKLRSIFDF